MPSLWSLIVKDKAATAEPLLPAGPGWLNDLREARPTLVNISDFIKQIAHRPDSEDGNPGPQDITPCRGHLWLEFLAAKPPYVPFRQAIEIEREDIPEGHGSNAPDGLAIPAGARHRVGFAAWQEQEGMALLWGMSAMFADHLGQPIDATIHMKRRDNDDAERLKLLTNIAAEVLTIMNTRGTRIEPPLDKVPAEVGKPNRAPHSVWHTIHLPRFQVPPLENAVIDGPVLERREHWVRAHRRDYRKGAGMFGRVKALVWVPEYQRGNPELGSVQASYKVEVPSD